MKANAFRLAVLCGVCLAAKQVHSETSPFRTSSSHRSATHGNNLRC